MQKTGRLAQSTAQSFRHAKHGRLVSVVVTTKNEEENIENCLRSIKNQTFQNVELIVVDNYSVDGTVEIARKYTTNVYLEGPERSSQRNFGAKVATGKYLLYLDADMILCPNIIEECLEKCERNRIDALYIPERIIGEGFWIRVRDFERSFYTGTVIDAVRFIRKDLFEKVGGFDESLVGPEDWDFDRRIRKISRTGITSAALHHNEGSFDVRNYVRKKNYYASGIKRYVEKWGPNDAETAKQVGAWYRLIGVFVEKSKWKKLMRHPLFVIAMCSLRLRVAVGYLRNAK